MNQPQTPTVTVTMLGASGSGKSTFMLGMYAILAGGVAGYFAHAAHDQHVQLMGSWDRLNDDGKLPPPNAEQPITYQFTFLRGITPLLSIDWMDYRGGALNDLSTASDTAALATRLAESDSVYLVLDGSVLAQWLRAMLDSEIAHQRRPELLKHRRKLRVEDMTRMLMDAVLTRQRAGRRRPSIVVVVTKMDTLAPISGLTHEEAVTLIQDYLKDLLPVAQSDGVTTLLQPVQLGEFGTDSRTDTVDVDSVAPRDLEKPFIFTFLEYLSDRIQEETEFLQVVGRRQAETAQELATLRGRFGASIWAGSRLDRLTNEQQALVADAEAKRQALEQMRRQAEQLRPDLNHAWIIRNQQLSEPIR